jgi:carboxypeptidase Q
MIRMPGGHLLAALVVIIILQYQARSQYGAGEETVDSIVVAQMMEEGSTRSEVMKILAEITERYGPRLTWSPEYKRTLHGMSEMLRTMGFANVHTESWGPPQRGWSLRRHSAHVTSPVVFPVISYPKAWSPGTDKLVSGDVVFFDAKTDSAIDSFKGTLKGKFVLMGDIRPLTPHFEPLARRETDTYLLELSNADKPQMRRRRQDSPFAARRRQTAPIEYKKMVMAQQEGAIAILTPSTYDGGNMMVLSASVPTHPDTPFARRIRPYEPHAPKILPQLAVAAEHYNRMIRMLQMGERVRMEMDLQVRFSGPDSGYNLLAEIPGTDLKDEVVMLGAHLDSWHGGTGTTDNGTGVAACIEALRIIKALGLQPRRTIRIGLWGGEEQGLLGSRAHAARYGTRKDDGTFELTTAGKKFSVYFNNDNGTGKIRGVYMQGNEKVRPIFRAWLAPFKESGAGTLTILNTASTDHASFDALGLPAFQFIQDEIEYLNRTWHSTMDTYERAIEDDLKQTSIIMAAFAYHAAMRDERLPRKIEQEEEHVATE